MNAGGRIFGFIVVGTELASLEGSEKYLLFLVSYKYAESISYDP